jgi:uncharacterized damage-inducible protein DinB
VITPGWVRLMAAYNGEMNRRLYAAADRLTEAERCEDRGAFFGSIQATLNHLLWGDRMWMSRFDGWEKPAVAIADSPRLHPDWDGLKADRAATDARIADWAGRVDPAWLAGELTWVSSAARQEMTRPVAVLVTHFFNHQTHHRGQAHALLTAFGAETGATDLPFILPFD